MKGISLKKTRIKEVSGWMNCVFTLLLALPLIQCSHRFWEPQPQEVRIPVRISYQGLEAKKVCIAGNFNHWSPQADCLAKEGDHWSIELWLAPGRYQYLLFIDDRQWKLDPSAPLIEDSGFGTENSVLIVD